MTAKWRVLTDVSDIVRFRQAGLCYYKGALCYGPSGWRQLPAEVVHSTLIANNISLGYKYAILVDDDG